jgi:hypothetical protein
MIYWIEYNGNHCVTQACPSHNKFVNRYIPTKSILAVDYYETVGDWMADVTCECTDIERKHEIMASLALLPPFPLYRVMAKNKGGQTKTFHYILDPSEHEHMERYLAGTDDPMYDFVHELRHNPRALPTSTELVEATERYNKRAKI